MKFKLTPASQLADVRGEMLEEHLRKINEMIISANAQGATTKQVQLKSIPTNLHKQIKEALRNAGYMAIEQSGHDPRDGDSWHYLNVTWS